MAKKENNAEKSNGGNSKNLIIIILVVILAALGAGGGVYILTQKKAPATAVEKEVKNIAYFDLGEYLLNLKGDTKVNKYLKTTVNISYDGDNKDLVTELESQKPAIRGVGLEFLQSKSSEDFIPASKSSGEHNIDVTKKALITELNKKITKGRIIDVYFQDLIIQ